MRINSTDKANCSVRKGRYNYANYFCHEKGMRYFLNCGRGATPMGLKLKSCLKVKNSFHGILKTT